MELLPAAGGAARGGGRGGPGGGGAGGVAARGSPRPGGPARTTWPGTATSTPSAVPANVWADAGAAVTPAGTSPAAQSHPSSVDARMMSPLLVPSTR